MIDLRVAKMHYLIDSKLKGLDYLIDFGRMMILVIEKGLLQNNIVNHKFDLNQLPH
jgi:hypothetical protein